LGALLRQRPDAAVPPPADFDVLASRLSSQHSVSRVAETVDQFVLDVLEALVLGSADEDELAQFCQVPLADIRRATAIAVTLGLAWRDGTGRLRVVKGVRSAVGDYPLGLGRAFAQLLAEVPQNVRVQIRDDLGLAEDETPTKALNAYFADPEAVAVLLDELSEGQRAILTQLASGPAVGEVEGRLRFVRVEEAETGIERLLARGLLIAIASDAVELPREVGLALRGDRPAGNVSPHPPAIAGRAVAVKEIDGGGASTALDALRLFEALLERWDAAPPALTRAGGLPVRELRAAAKALGVEQDVVALIVQTVTAASLAGRTAGVDPVMVPTERYDRWRDAPMAERWALLAAAWCGMDQLPGLAVHEDGTKAAALLTYDMVRPGAGELRRDVLAAMAAAGKGHAPDLDRLPAWLSWRVPTRSGRYIDQVCAWTLKEAQFLGVTGRGALTTAGRVLLDSPHAPAARSGDETEARAYRDDIAAALAPSLPAPIEHVLIQADLTAVAPGPLLPHIARELALIADIESAGAATVYRFSEASLRRAFDAGRTAVELHQLIERLARGTVPQGLTYLIDDIARRHGRLRAGSAAGYLRSDDPALLAEVVANRRTASAALVLVAPTVAVSPLEPAQILAVLREAGYAPAGDAGRGGGIVIEQSGGRRVPVAAAGRGQSVGWSAGTNLPDSHVTQTISMLRRVASLRRPGRSRQAPEPDGSSTVGTPEAISLLLREAAADSSAVWISYVNAEGRHSRRTVYPTLVSGGFLIGLDDETGERRTFAISRIQEAAAV
ncbi:MAG TPA: helicase-associated domain-containing protein, partial [Frankiaceae bacterium]|nr:helicase-associated domain-containing protein [Frankiaceae bacterium]